MENEGASNNERLLAAARSDNEDLLIEIFDEPGTFNVNYRDGLGNTALHYAVSSASLDVLEHILAHEECDVDLTNTLEGATPLHLAVKTQDAETRVHLVKSLLDAGVDDTVLDKNGDRAQDLVSRDDDATLSAFREAHADKLIDNDDIAHDDEDEDDEDEDESD